MAESLNEQLSSISISNTDCFDTSKQHPRFAQYKTKTLPDQNVRRQRELQRQKKKRAQMHALVRLLQDEENMETEAESKDSGCSEETRPKKHGKKKTLRPYANQVMLSEWLHEKPDDFQSNWITVICPKGKRNLVIACGGTTRAYARNGIMIKRFTSALPGGSKSHRGKFSILDCIYCEKLQTFFVIDLMCWNNHPIYDSDYSFRSYFLHGKMQESSELSTVSRTNRFKFMVVPTVNSTDGSEIYEALKIDTDYEVDGLLFYHKDGHYNTGIQSSLVNWLKPHMLPAVLGFKVPEKYQQIDVEMTE